MSRALLHSIVIVNFDINTGRALGFFLEENTISHLGSILYFES